MLKYLVHNIYVKEEKENQLVLNLYLQRGLDNHISDGEPRALYWINYRRKFNDLMDCLILGNQVPDDQIVCLLSNNLLHPHDFDLRKKDRLPIGDMNEPGKSAHIHFSDNPHEVYGAIMDRDLKRQDAVYISSVKDILDAGWKPVFAPTPNLPLHIRLVPTEFVGIDPVQPIMNIRRRLVETFNHNKIRRIDFMG